jgi:hypothetical protein
MIVGFLALRFPGKTYVLCVIDISLCDCGCDRGLIFCKNNSRSDYVFNKWRKLLDQENHRNTLSVSKFLHGIRATEATELRK